MSESDNQAHNKKGAKGYQDYIVGKLEKDFEVETFPKTDENKVTDEVDDVPANNDFVEEAEGKIAPQLKAGSEEIEHSEESFKHTDDLTDELPDESAIKKGLGLKDVSSGGGTN